MTRRGRLASASVALLCSAPSILAAQPEEDLPLPPSARSIDLPSVDKSLPELLQDGYEVVALSNGVAGSGYVLKKDRDFVICVLGLYGSATSLKPYSDCQHLSKPKG